MQTIFMFFLRLAMLVAGLILAASLLCAAALVLAFWALRAVWYRITGRPVMPFFMRADRRASFSRMYRAGRAPSEAQSGPAKPVRRAPLADVTDVEPK